MKKLLLVALIAAGRLMAAEAVPGSVTVHTAKPENAVTFSPAQATNEFLSSFVGWALEDEGHLPRRDAVLAVGSSSMRLWKTIGTDLAPLEIVHRGFGGSRMKDVLEMMDFFTRYQCRTVLVYEGDNDLMDQKLTPEEYISQCEAFVRGIRSARPDAKIYFISTKPSPAREQFLPKFTKANEIAKNLCESGKNLAFIDVFTPMLGADGKPRAELFGQDATHLNGQGYALWTKVVRSHLFPRESK